MSLHLQVIVATFLFATLAILGSRFTAVQLGASTQSNEIVGVTELVSSDFAKLQSDVKNLSPGEMEFEKVAINDRVYSRKAIIEDGPHKKSYVVVLEVKETGSLGVRNRKFKTVLYR